MIFYYVSYMLFFNKACSWSIGFFQVLNISKLHHVFRRNHSTFYVQIFFSVISVQIFSIKNVNPSFYIKYVENGYFLLLAKFEMYGKHVKNGYFPLLCRFEMTQLDLIEIRQ
jgi:hypothetical protein